MKAGASRQSQAEDGAGIRLRFDVNGAAMGTDHAAGYRQAQSGAVGTCREEWLEQPGLRRSIHAATVVSHPKADFTANTLR